MPTCYVCSKKVRNLEYHLSAEIFADKIVEMIAAGYSLLYLAKNSEALFGTKITYDIIGVVLSHRHIPKPTLKDTANSKPVRDLYRKTVEDKYGIGITNVSQVPWVKRKKEEVNLERYGVVNPFQRQDIKDQTKATMLERYGVYNACDLLGKTNTNGRYSRPHKKVSIFLTEAGIPHLNDLPGQFRKHNDDLNRTYSPIPDIYIPEKNLVIEIFGDRWHMNPSIYYETDVVKFFDGFHTAKEVWEGDRIRNEHIKSFGVDLLVIWEYDIKHNFNKVKCCIEDKLNEVSSD